MTKPRKAVIQTEGLAASLSQKACAIGRIACESFASTVVIVGSRSDRRDPTMKFLLERFHATHNCAFSLAPHSEQAALRQMAH